MEDIYHIRLQRLRFLVRELPKLPEEMLCEVLQFLPTKVALQMALVSRSWSVAAIAQRTFLDFTPAYKGLLPMLGFTAFAAAPILPRFRWVPRIAKLTKELRLTELLVGQKPNVDSDLLAQLLSLSPLLRVLSVADPPTSDSLRSALANHPALHSVKFTNLKSNSFDLIGCLPIQLTALEIAALSKSPLPEAFFQRFAAACPNITSLSLVTASPGDTACLQSLKQLRFLDCLNITFATDKSNFPLSRNNHVRFVADLLPVPRNNRWRDLQVGSFSLAKIFAHNRENLQALRQALSFGMHPTRNSLALHPEILQTMSDAAQEQYYQFLLEENSLTPSPCRCTTGNCEHSLFILETYFVPFVEAKIQLLPELDLAALATSLLSLTYPQMAETQRLYLRGHPWKTVTRLFRSLEPFAIQEDSNLRLGLFTQVEERNWYYSMRESEEEGTLEPLVSHPGWTSRSFKAGSEEFTAASATILFDTDNSKRLICLPALPKVNPHPGPPPLSETDFMMAPDDDLENLDEEMDDDNPDE